MEWCHEPSNNLNHHFDFNFGWRAAQLGLPQLWVGTEWHCWYPACGDFDFVFNGATLIPPKDLVALINTVAVPLEIITILAVLGYTGRTLGEQGAEVILAVIGGQVAATVAYLAR